MSMQAEDTLRDSIEEMWEDVIVPHVFHANEDIPIQGGTDVHILNHSMERIKANFYAMMMLHHEPTIEEAIDNMMLEDDDDDEEDDDDAPSADDDHTLNRS